MILDERLEAVAKGVKAVSETMAPFAGQSDADSGEQSNLVRKHAALLAEWEATQSESETLRDELKEDKWLIVFRTVTEQAGGLMTSLEKGVNRCQVRRYLRCEIRILFFIFFARILLLKCTKDDLRILHCDLRCDRKRLLQISRRI